LLAAVVAALLATAWHEVVSEPLIEQAIQIEEARQPGVAEEPVVSRPVQRAGLGLALVLYGITWGLAVGGVFSLAQEHLPGDSFGKRALLFALAVGWAVALLPFLKYPSNPPGVGDPSTLQDRQFWYFASMVLGSLGALAATLLARRMDAGRASGQSARHPWMIALIAYAVFCVALLVVLPSSSDAAPLPADLLYGFRLRSFLGLVVFWGAFAAVFGHFVQRWSRVASPAPRPQAESARL
jgi:predicted cobalt transporter CbtA